MQVQSRGKDDRSFTADTQFQGFAWRKPFRINGFISITCCDLALWGANDEEMSVEALLHKAGRDPPRELAQAVKAQLHIGLTHNVEKFALASLDQLPVIESPAQQGALLDALAEAASPDQPALPMDEPAAESDIEPDTPIEPTGLDDPDAPTAPPGTPT